MDSLDRHKCCLVPLNRRRPGSLYSIVEYKYIAAILTGLLASDRVASILRLGRLSPDSDERLAADGPDLYRQEAVRRLDLAACRECEATQALSGGCNPNLNHLSGSGCPLIRRFLQGTPPI